MDTPTHGQQEVIDLLFSDPFWKQGRGAGKSWLRKRLILMLREAEMEESSFNPYVEVPE